MLCKHAMHFDTAFSIGERTVTSKSTYGHFCKTEIEFLGHVVSAAGVNVDPETIFVV
jgi:hypothetical protein